MSSSQELSSSFSTTNGDQISRLEDNTILELSRIYNINETIIRDLLKENNIIYNLNQHHKKIIELIKDFTSAELNELSSLEPHEEMSDQESHEEMPNIESVQESHEEMPNIEPDQELRPESQDSTSYAEVTKCKTI
ncbi:6128_t:CDS:2 [Entrophospora sp. SA101]|nr:8665_t:CDS:2 [Entrophospora sp. SA101]CAJ0762500.1 6128_t:CDS:2 [Entrophospora sp. SA101]CAJ0908426.1 383_t:CDS:2 [Entrophospora sp. SA101]CAJ0926910.1 20813_t:CDS:2 [Entrophospora sp. SA101]